MSKILEQLYHTDEIPYLVQLKFAMKPPDLSKYSPHLAFCYGRLHKVSRSFAAVIQQLGEELRHPICLFYLILRGLDTIEDDMKIPLNKKLPILRDFQNVIYQSGWNSKKADISISTEGDKAAELMEYKILVDEFHLVIKAFLELKPKYQDIIKDITYKMGCGMADYAEKGTRVDTVEDLDKYCHYVAGLVGIGLTHMFLVSEMEEKMVNCDDIANSMGLFLQKTNIIRDYLEDMLDRRIFWPQSIWSKYAEKIEDLAKPENQEAAVKCLNELICDTMRHAIDCLSYMEKLNDPKNFAFCAIPQIMAIATLNKLYNNPIVFAQNTKIRKGESAEIFLKCSNIQYVRGWFNYYSRQITKKLVPTDPSTEKLRTRLQKIKELTQKDANKVKSSYGMPFTIVLAIVIAIILNLLLTTFKSQ